MKIKKVNEHKIVKKLYWEFWENKIAIDFEELNKKNKQEELNEKSKQEELNEKNKQDDKKEKEIESEIINDIQKNPIKKNIKQIVNKNINFEDIYINFGEERLFKSLNLFTHADVEDHGVLYTSFSTGKKI